MQSKFLLLALVGAMNAAATDAPKTSEDAFTNRLANEESPYLLQHAHNPVDWYPWASGKKKE